MMYDMNRKRRLAELMADHITRIAQREMKPGGSLFASSIGVLISDDLRMEAARAAEADLREELSKQEKL